MADWLAMVRQRLSGLALDVTEKDEVHAELAAHLEESYQALRAQGVPEQTATRSTLSQVSNWEDLQRKIFIAKRRVHPMKKRMQQLWIPGFLTLTLSMIFLPVLQRLGFQPRIAWSGQFSVFLYVPWLLSLLFLGALGAYVSSRAGGSRGTALLASVFPALALTAAFLSMFPIGFLIESIIGSQGDFSNVATALLKDGIGWLLVPGAALLAGGLPAQLFLSRRLTLRHVAGL